MLILATFLVAAALVAVLTLTTFRLLTRWCGTTQLFEDGAVLTDDGIEYLRFCLLGRAKATFDEIESVEFLPFGKALFPILFFRYGYSLLIIRTRLFSDCVLVAFRRSPRWFDLYFKYVLFTPKHPADFVEQLKSRLKRYERHVA
jgi:hypothetical protein